jgi:hypothetical protein
MISVVTGEVRRIAHHRLRSLTANYYHNPRVSASFDGSVVTWASNFGYSGNGYVDIYAFLVDGVGSGSGSQSNPVPSTPVSTGSSGGTVLTAAQLAAIDYARNGNGTYFGDGVNASTAYARAVAAGRATPLTSGTAPAGPLSASQLAAIAYASNGNGTYFADQVDAATAYGRVVK